MSTAAVGLTFAPDLVWRALYELLQQDLGGKADIDRIGQKDFNEEGAFTLNPPAVRILFMEESAPEIIESQALNYAVHQDYALLCADEDRVDPQGQRDSSLELAAQVKLSLVGARLQLPGGNISEPVQYRGMAALPADGIGQAYAPIFRVPGIASFPGTHAQPTQGANNG